MVSDYTIESGYEQAEKLLREHPETDGIICATDTIAHGVMKAVKAAGKRIPEDISVTGVGNSWADTITEPQLTTVKLYFEECGRVAVNILMQMINSKDKDIPVSNLKLGYQIIERGSV
jgi:LacI family sucrose operon transcriptional repressor